MNTAKLTAALLALLGFTRCEHIGTMEYGMPHASFEIKGVVTDEAGEPVRDIKISVRDAAPDRSEGEVGVGITNAYGYYSVDGSWFGGSDLVVAVEDIDGDKNGGEFAPQDRELKIEEEDYVGGEGWNRGTVTKTADFEISLKPSGDENE
jgi:putative lipoprotein (rSAM/lipoprotein system)